MELIKKIEKDYLANQKALKGKFTLKEYILKCLEEMITTKKKEIARLAKLKKQVKLSSLLDE